MSSARDLTSKILRDPRSVLALKPADLDLLVRQARRGLLLPRLGLVLKENGCLDQLPTAARDHFEAALVIAEKQNQAVRWEVNRIEAALAAAVPETILLKGAAYVMAELPAARGRFFSDVDILVPKARLGAAEAALMLSGWVSTHHDAYDQRYYRNWMHELPPMLHLDRQTVLDVHHSILPDTARLQPDPQELLASAVPVQGHGRLRVLAPPDMVLHSATHLFHEGEFDHALRDLTDLDALLRDFSAKDPSFWEILAARARQLDLSRPLYYALRYTAAILGTPVPPAITAVMARDAPNPLMIRLMDLLFARAFIPRHATCDRWVTKPALWLLFVRSHWLKMPLRLLVPHLLHQTLARTGKQQ
jgi:hypothetical protein